MKAVIPCAGEGIRMRPLTLTRPKQLLEIGGKPILEHIFDSLPVVIDEVILVVGYLGEQIRNHFRDEFEGRKIHYAVQDKKTGTWGALLAAKPLLGEGKFLLLFGEDILDGGSIEKCLRHDLALLVKEVSDPRPYGVVMADGVGRILNFVEKPLNPLSNIVNTGVHILDERIFNYSADPHPTNGEFYLTSAVEKLAKDYDVFVEHAVFWLPVTTPEDIPRVEEELLKLRIA